MLGNYFTRFLQTGPIRFYSVTILSCVLILLVVAFATAHDGRTVLGSNLGADFAQFYVVGKVFNDYSAASLYDRELERSLYHSLMPEETASSSLPYFYPPYFVPVLGLLARLSYAKAYTAWLITGLAAYLAGLALLRHRIPKLSERDWRTAVLLALSFSPFAVESWAGGQLSIWGFLLMSVALWADLRFPIVSGIALALCSYKPTLLILVVPMLILTRRWRALTGFASGIVVIAATSLALVGTRPNLAYLAALAGYGGEITAGAVGLRRWKYVDLNSFLTMLVGQGGLLRWVLALALLVMGLFIVARFRSRVLDLRSLDQDLLWSLTIVGTLLLNLYVPIYDCVLLVPAALLVVNVALMNEQDRWARKVPYMLAGLHLMAWVTQSIARATTIQLYTLVLIAFSASLVKWMLEKEASREPICS
jgi:hypothetical protein